MASFFRRDGRVGVQCVGGGHVSSHEGAGSYAAPFSWTGFYLGASAGGIGLSSENTYSTSDPGVPGTSDTNRGSGVLAGGTVGYNFQTGQWVIGIEADYSMASAQTGNSANFNFAGGNGIANISNLGTVRGRLGWASDHTLLYITGGLAWGDVTNTASAPNFCVRLQTGFLRNAHRLDLRRRRRACSDRSLHRQARSPLCGFRHEIHFFERERVQLRLPSQDDRGDWPAWPELQVLKQSDGRGKAGLASPAFLLELSQFASSFSRMRALTIFPISLRLIRSSTLTRAIFQRGFFDSRKSLIACSLVAPDAVTPSHIC